MKEDNFAEMSLARMINLCKTWRSQADHAENIGDDIKAKYLRGKATKLNTQIGVRQNEQFNDLFE